MLMRLSPRLTATIRLQAVARSFHATPSFAMRAVLFDKNGPSSVLHVADVPKPEPSPADVVTKVAYAGINFIDIYYREGLYPVKFPFTSGREAAGTIEAIGKDVPSHLNLKVGDRVTTWGDAMMAEYTSTPANRIIKLPNDVSFRDGAAIPLQGLTALTLVRDAYEVKKGDWILVPAAAGGTGGLVAQMANHLGAHVIGTASTPEKLEIAKKNGCEVVFNYTDKNLVDEVLKATDGQGVHAVISGIGKATFQDELKCIRRKGSMVTFGNASGAIEPISPLILGGTKNIKLVRPRMDAYLVTDEEFKERSTELMEWLEKGYVKVDVGHEYTLDQVGQAQDDLAGRKTTGKLVVKVA